MIRYSFFADFCLILVKLSVMSLAKAMIVRSGGGDPDFSTLRTDTNLTGKAGLLPVGVNHTLALFDVLKQVDEGKIPGTDKMDASGKESFKKKIREDYLKDMGSYGFTPEQAKNMYYDVKNGYQTSNYGPTVKEGLRWNASQGFGESNDEMRQKSQRTLVYRNYGTGSKNYVFKEGVLDEPAPLRDTRQMIANYLAQKKSP